MSNRNDELGAVQMLRDRGDDGNGTPLLAAVGQLQFEVVEYRLKHEYGVESRMEPLGSTMHPYHTYTYTYMHSYPTIPY